MKKMRLLQEGWKLRSEIVSRRSREKKREEQWKLRFLNAATNETSVTVFAQCSPRFAVPVKDVETLNEERYKSPPPSLSLFLSPVHGRLPRRVFSVFPHSQVCVRVKAGHSMLQVQQYISILSRDGECKWRIL